MSEFIKISGKKIKLSSESKPKWMLTRRPGGWIIAVSESGVRRRLMFQESRSRWSASLQGVLWTGEWLSIDRELGEQDNSGDLVAQFPGKVRKILIESGNHVLKGDSLLLIEAMKMEFTIRAPFSGRVTRILVQEGQQLSSGDEFLDLEAVANGD